MSLEEKLRAYAAKGELVHLSLMATGDTFNCTFAAASPVGGYATGQDADPVEAIEKALKASPAKRAKASKEHRGVDPVTAAVFDAEGEKVGGLSSEWTTP